MTNPYQNLSYTREINRLTSKVDNLQDENNDLVNKNNDLIDLNDHNQKVALQTQRDLAYQHDFDSYMKELNNTDLYGTSNNGSNSQLLTRADKIKLYERNVELEQLYENAQDLSQKCNDESKMNIDVSGKFKKLYEREKLKTQKLTMELELAYKRIEGLQDQCFKQGMLSEELSKSLSKYDY